MPAVSGTQKKKQYKPKWSAQGPRPVHQRKERHSSEPGRVEQAETYSESEPRRSRKEVGKWKWEYRGIALIALIALFAWAAITDPMFLRGFGPVPDIPTYPGVSPHEWNPPRPVAGVDVWPDSLNATEATFITSDSREKVFDFYKVEMQRAGWRWINTGYIPSVDETLYFDFEKHRRRGRDVSYRVTITTEPERDGRIRVRISQVVFK